MYTYKSSVLACGVDKIVQHLKEHQPDTLLNKEEINALNEGTKPQLKRGGKSVRNPEWRSNSIQNEKEVCKDIAKLLWKDAAHSKPHYLKLNSRAVTRRLKPRKIF